MRWSDVITLITQTLQAPDSDGFIATPIESMHTVYGNKKYVWHAEFYAALQSGVNSEFKFDVPACDYAGEKYALYANKRYKITRAEISKNGEIMALTLADLSERDGP